jgi:hypothetical protein
MPRKPASEKPAKTVRKREEPRVTVTIIRHRPEDDPAGYASFCAWVKRRVNKILAENPNLLEAKDIKAECAAGEEGIDNRTSST